MARLRVPAAEARYDYYAVAFEGDKEVERHRIPVSLDREPAKRDPLYGSVELVSLPDKVVLQVTCGSGTTMTIAQRSIPQLEIHAEAIAQPSIRANPVDLATVLVPNDWLLVLRGQTAVVTVAAIARVRDIENARLKVWVDGGAPTEASLQLKRGVRAQRELTMSIASTHESVVLHAAIDVDGRRLWHQEIRTMIVAQRQKWPSFGAVETQLRYDATISIKNKIDGSYSSLEYVKGWDKKLNDVVVFLPNGARFVFWRGSSYVPFWAGLYNTGFSYQWAETIPPPKFTDAVEPLQDKELRHSSVKIVESTSARVHVRWTYQSMDVDYKTLGDEAIEDFYFYPDGFGTRVVTIASDRPKDYMFSEFIVITPQSMYPLDALPEPTVDIMFLDGDRRRVRFPVQGMDFESMSIPFPAEMEGVDYHPVERVFAQILKYRSEQGMSVSAADVEAISSALRKVTYPSAVAIYRILDHKSDAMTPIYFSPYQSRSILAFPPFTDRGQIVSPAYWGDHWPLGRGALTGGAISDRVYSSPSHIGLMDLTEPEPITVSSRRVVDAHGNDRLMSFETRAWLISKTDIPDDELLIWAESFSSVPSAELAGARLDFPSYSQERRALRLIVESSNVRVRLKPKKWLRNPVIELSQARANIERIYIDGKRLEANQYAWDGQVLWLAVDIGEQGSVVQLEFR